MTPKRIKQTISVPFLWEEKPGTPKDDWQQRINPIMQLPVKLIASVPFIWEEKPGTPLHQNHNFYTNNNNNNNNPFCDPPPPLESEYSNFVQSKIYNHKTNPFCDSSDDEFEFQAPSSPAWETESVESGFTTTSTLAGSSFLECMFPLLTSKSSSINTTTTTANCTQIVAYGGGVERKPLTLGELIMMSRRRSFLKKTVEKHEYNHSTELMMTNGFGCCINIDIGGLQKLKRQLQLN